MVEGTRCPQCGATFDDPTAATDHAKKAHGMVSAAIPPAPGLSCPACGRSFAAQDALQLHARASHGSAAASEPSRSVRAARILGWGALGGIVGGLGLAGVMAITGKLLGLPVTMLAVIAQAMLGISATSGGAMGAGLTLHLLSSLLIGVVLVGSVLGISRASRRFSRIFFPTSGSRTVSAGLLGGFLVLLVVGLPLLFEVLVPTMHALMTNMIVMQGAARPTASGMATAKLSGWMPGVLTGFLLGHVVYGLLLAGFVYVGVRLDLRSTGHPTVVERSRRSSA